LPICTTAPNFVQVGQAVPEIWPFIEFFKMAAVCHLGFSKVGNLNSRYPSEGQNASSCRILCRSVEPLWRYGRLQFFKMANFGLLGHIADVITHAKFCDNRFRGYGVLIPPILPFSIGIAGRPYNSVSTTMLHCDDILLCKGNSMQPAVRTEGNLSCS